MEEYINNGYFSESGHEYIITKRDIERNWYNYLWNDRYITFISQVGVGEGFSQDEAGNRIQLLSGRALYLKEEGEAWNALAASMTEKFDDFDCTHGIGYSTIREVKNKIESRYTVFVPDGMEGEVIILKLRNLSESARKISVIPYFATEIDGPYMPQGYNTSQCGFDDSGNFIYASYLGRFNGNYGKRIACLGSSEAIKSYDTAENCFIGKYGNAFCPKAIQCGKLSNSNAFAEKVCFAVENSVMLLPNEEKEIVYVLSLFDNRNAAIETIKEVCKPTYAENALQTNIEKYRKRTDGVFINTPDKELNKLFNYWLKYETDMSSRWARVRHNGYRDILSDTDCLAGVNPELALERAKRILGYQYSNGYAPRTFINGEIRDNNFADNCVWIVFTMNYIVKELGRKDILDIKVPYNDGTEGTIYEHIKKAVDFLWEFRGHHDLIRIWGGDWNDSINHAGLKGKGVSLWLSIAWCRANKEFAELARMTNRTTDYEVSCHREKEMEELVDKYGWDGSYYLYGYSDNGSPFGSSQCEEGKIHLIPQLWAVIANIGSDEQRASALSEVEKQLDSELGTIALAPSYTHYDGQIGEMTAKPVGLFLNGGVYMHTMCWKLAVDCMIKDRELAQRDLNRLLPFRNKVVANRAEPYVMCNSYFGIDSGYRYGTAGQSWRTAANGWLLKALTNFIFGLKPEMKGIRVEPCIPCEWKTAEITKRFREAVYRIQYENGGNEVKSIKVDGIPIESNILPYEAGGEYDVKVIMG